MKYACFYQFSFIPIKMCKQSKKIGTWIMKHYHVFMLPLSQVRVPTKGNMASFPLRWCPKPVETELYHEGSHSDSLVYWSSLFADPSEACQPGRPQWNQWPLTRGGNRCLSASPWCEINYLDQLEIDHHTQFIAPCAFAIIALHRLPSGHNIDVLLLSSGVW